MRRGLTAAVATAAVVAVVIGTSSAATTSVPAPLGNLDFTLGLSLAPKTLPKRTFAPATANIVGEVATKDGTHPPALREIALDVDRDVKLDTEGIPICRPPERSTRTAVKACRPSIVGAGNADIEFAFPEQKPLIVSPPVTIFNGGTEAGETTLFVHTFVTIPVPAAVVATVRVRRLAGGLRSVTKIPVIAGGAGSLIDFKLRLGSDYTDKDRRRSLLTARCPDGRFKVTSSKVVFRNEAGVPNVPPTTVLKGSVLIPCTPKGQLG